MEGGEEVLPSATATSAATGNPTASPPPLADLVGAPDLAAASDDVVTQPEIHALISDEEHDHEHEHDDDLEHEHDQHEHDHHHEDRDDHAAVAAVSLEDLKLKIIKQAEYYFSDENLPTDKYLLGFVKRNKEGFVPVSVIASFRKIKKLTRDHAFIVAALKESSLLVVSGDGRRVKRLNPLRFNESRDHKLYTVLVENLPEDHSKKNIQQIFHEAGKYDFFLNLCLCIHASKSAMMLTFLICSIKRITIHDPHSTSESAKQHNKQEMLISNKLHALVEYETMEAAEKAVAMLNNEQDWRNGMRVKLLKGMGKYGHKKQAWKGHHSEKNSSRPEQTGDEENHGSNDHHEDTHEEEDGDHLSKDKGGQRYRNQGRSRKHKYRAGNGMGHGSAPSTHAAEASKSPPGPRMPDGTRGFAVGRGRPPVPASN
ncbi:la-related protein 6A isoform X1 [Glycine max]|uniref:la-related protein 6A isoform X1 n=1 Tax=Glycine max TaxID=3847 RepID=UPI001B355E7D|nr:la-related protein 6A isoform X1 [Glycine max]